MKRLLVYGSLRKGCHNHEQFTRRAKENNGTFNEIETDIEIKGYTMFSFGRYPAIIPSLKKEHSTIVADLIEVDDKTYEGILDLEVRSGYSQHYNLNNDAYIFVYTRPLKHDDYKEIVEDGNWLNSADKF